MLEVKRSGDRCWINPRYIVWIDANGEAGSRIKIRGEHIFFHDDRKPDALAEIVTFMLELER